MSRLNTLGFQIQDMSLGKCFIICLAIALNVYNHDETVLLLYRVGFLTSLYSWYVYLMHYAADSICYDICV